MSAARLYQWTAVAASNIIRTGSGCEGVDKVPNDQPAYKAHNSRERDRSRALAQRDASDEYDGLQTLAHNGDERQNEQTPFTRDGRAVGVYEESELD